jgi:hypothetical protein
VLQVSAVKNRDIEMQIAARDGKIVLLFSRRKPNGELVKAKTDNFDFEASHATRMAQLICDLAFEIDTTLKPLGDTLKVELAERHRITLTHRIAIVLGTLREDKLKSNGMLAKELVDIMMKEVFV